ncbi:Centrosomal protein of 89 kDa [Willisornis vidua]|uniref:Centrosomal protein of 89 kDa n=1 Tax=Willisornis vidua TaxID=1566151 RepID=A0ABQ9D3N2_9PASS|nr:Centrosomal protein of 89 kDa [Willisornis vidua]
MAHVRGPGHGQPCEPPQRVRTAPEPGPERDVAPRSCRVNGRHILANRATTNNKVREQVLLELSFVNSDLQILKEELEGLNISVEVYQNAEETFSIPLVPLGLKETKEVDFTLPLKDFILEHYSEDSSEYEDEIADLMDLRQACRTPSRDEAGIEMLISYFLQLGYVENRFFPPTRHMGVLFTWYDSFTGVPVCQQNLLLEKASILFNIGALYTQIGTRCNRQTQAGLENAVDAFQKAAGVLSYLKETFTHTPSYDMSPAMLNVLVKMMLAQARECVFEQIGLSGIRNEFFTLVKMTQEVAKPGDDEDQQEKALSQLYDHMPEGLMALAVLRDKLRRKQLGKAHLRKAIVYHEEALRVCGLCKKLRNIDVLQEVLTAAHKRSLLKYAQQETEDDFLSLIQAPNVLPKTEHKIETIAPQFSKVKVKDFFHKLSMGLKEGDYIVSVGGVDCKWLGVNEVLEKLRSVGEQPVEMEVISCQDTAASLKHIAHGLVPAASIAPKPAVPRTPPPRSPNPSPERPRSALAAAILATTLTGRTVAIPQPRHRSLSESDSTSVEQEGFEPYATATELRIGSTWKLDGCDRSPEQSLEISGNYGEDEDMDTYVSDADREAESSCQSSEKREESFSTNAIYAVPCKNKKEEFLPSPSPKADKKEVPSHGTESQVVVEKSSLEVEAEDQHLGLNLKEEKSVPENLICEKPPLSPDVSVRARQAWEQMTKEKFRELKQENWSLNKAYQAVVQQFEGTKQQMEEQQLKLKKLEQENRRLKEAVEKSHREEEATELLSLRQQAQELVDENDALKMVVHRLNVELSRYQTKFRSLPQEELDVKYLSPLLLAYEDRIREKEDFILEHEQLQTQAKLVLEENGLLMEQLEIQQAKAKDSHRQHVQEASKLTKQIVILEGKKQSQEEEIGEYKKKLEALYSTCEDLKAKMDSRIAAEEHLAVVNDLNRRLNQEQEKQRREVEDVLGKVAALQAENKKLLLEKNNFLADKKILESEMEMTQKTNRRLTKKIGHLQLQLEEVMEKEVTAHHYLTNLIGLVEKIAQERDHLVFLATSLENEKQGVLNKMIEGSLRLGRLEEKVKVYKKKAAGKLGDISLKMTEQEKDFAGKIVRYEQEMRHLRHLLQDKQETLEEVLQEKRKTEGELEIIWESTTKENKRMRELLQKSLRKNTMWSAVTVHEPHLDESSQKDLVYRHDFSYCDVKTSSPTKNEIQEESQ